MNSDKKRYIVFLLKFISIIFIYYSALLIPNNIIVIKYLELTTHISAFFISLFQQGVEVSGNLISTEENSIRLLFGCEGSEPIIILLAGIFAFPAEFKQKIKGFVLGASVLYFLNIIRIAVLFFISNESPQIFNNVHEVYFPLLFIFFSLIIWFIWIKIVSK